MPQTLPNPGRFPVQSPPLKVCLDDLRTAACVGMHALQERIEAHTRRAVLGELAVLEVAAARRLLWMLAMANGGALALSAEQVAAMEPRAGELVVEADADGALRVYADP